MAGDEQGKGKESGGNAPALDQQLRNKDTAVCLRYTVDM